MPAAISRAGGAFVVDQRGRCCAPEMPPRKSFLKCQPHVPTGNEKDRFPLFRGNYVIPISTGNQNSRFPPIRGSLVENVTGLPLTPPPRPLPPPTTHDPRKKRSRGLIYIFHEATTNRWKTAILVSTGNGDDIISSKQWKTVLFVSSGHMRLTLGKAFSGWHFWCTTMTPLVHNNRTSRRSPAV